MTNPPPTLVSSMALYSVGPELWHLRITLEVSPPMEEGCIYRKIQGLSHRPPYHPQLNHRWVLTHVLDMQLIPPALKQCPFSSVHSIMMEKSAQPGEGGGCTIHYIYHHVQSWSVRSSWEGRYILLYPYMYSVVLSVIQQVTQCDYCRQDD